MLGTEPAATLAGACPVGNQKNKQNCVHDEPGQLHVDAVEVELHEGLQDRSQGDEDPGEPHTGPPAAAEKRSTEQYAAPRMITIDRNPSARAFAGSPG